MVKLHSFIPLNFLFMFCAFFAAAADSLGSLVAGADVTMPSDAGESGDDAGPSGGEPPEPEQGADGEPGEPGAEPGKAAAQPQKSGPELRKPLTAGEKKFLGELKQSDPAAWKSLNSRIYTLEGLDKKIAEHFDEGGLDQAIQLKNDVGEFLRSADADDFGQIASELNGFRTVDAKIMAGDASFVNEMPQEMQAGLYKMMPNFVGEWQQRDNDGYQRFFAGLVAATLRDTGFSKNLEMAMWQLQRMGLDDADVKGIHDLFAGNLKWINDLSEKATAAPAPKTNAAPDAAAVERQQIETERLQMSRERFAKRFRELYDGRMLGALRTLAGGKIPADVNSREVLARAFRDLSITLGDSFADRIHEYLAAKDEQGAIKYLQTMVTDKKITEAVTKAQRYLYPGMGKQQQPAAKDKDRPGAGGQPNPAAGFVTINYNPHPRNIDLAASDKLAKSLHISRAQLFMQNKAVLRNGKKVQWSQDAEREE